MELISLVENMSKEMYLRLKTAVETGKWPEGTSVAEEQRQSAMHVVMAYQSRILKSDQIMTVGEDGSIVNKSKQELKTQFSSNASSSEQETPSQDIARFTQL